MRSPAAPPVAVGTNAHVTARVAGIVEKEITMSITYPGGKGGPGVYQTLISQMPPHQTYIETHLGGGAILRHKRPALLNVGIDLSGEALQAVAEVVQHRHGRRGLPESIVMDGDGFEELQLAPPQTTMMATLATRSDAAAPSAVAVMPGGTVAHSGTPAPSLMSVLARASIATHDGPRYDFIQTDCVPWLKSYPWQGHELVYADPPYLMHTRRGGRDLYEYEYTDADHEALLSVLRSLPCMVMVSGYWSELYADMLTGWRTVTFTTTDRGGNLREEWAWMNYAAPTALHDYSHLGADYRERERIKRKRQRWVRMLNDMPTLERAAIIDELTSLKPRHHTRKRDAGG